MVGEAANGDGGGGRVWPGRVHLGHGRGEDDVGTGFGAHGDVGVERAGVERDVLRVAELQRVHEDAHHDDVALAGRPGDERDVALVERAHGRDEGDVAAGGAGAVELGPTAGGGLDDVHDLHPHRDGNGCRL